MSSVESKKMNASKAAGGENAQKMKPLMLPLIGCAGLAGSALVMLGTAHYGIGIQPDSVSYISTARNIAAGTGFVLFNGDCFLNWPPLFPILLAALDLLTGDLLYGARIFNALGFGLIIAASGYLCLHTMKSRLCVLLATLSVVLSPPLLKVSAMALSEPFYILLSLLFFSACPASPRQKGVLPLLPCCVLASLACLQRYSGLSLVAAGTFCLLVQKDHAGKRAGMARAFIFCSLSFLPLLLWLVRNYVLSGTLTGPRLPAYYGLARNTALTIEALAAWLVPPVPDYPSRYALAALVIILLMVRCLAPSTLNTHTAIATNGKRPKRNIIAYTVIYVSFVIASSSLTANEIISESRLLTPIYPFLIFLLYAGVDGCLARLPSLLPGRRLLTLTVLLLSCTWLACQTVTVSHLLSSWRKDGIGENFLGYGYYTRGAWQESPLAKWLSKHPLKGLIYSNEPTALYALTGLAAHLPLRDTSPAGLASKAGIQQECFLVWFSDNYAGQKRFLHHQGQIHTLEKLNGLCTMTPLFTFTDGVLYRIDRDKKG